VRAREPTTPGCRVVMRKMSDIWSYNCSRPVTPAWHYQSRLDHRPTSASMIGLICTSRVWCDRWTGQTDGWDVEATLHSNAASAEVDCVQTFIYYKCKNCIVYLQLITAKWHIKNSKINERWYYFRSTLTVAKCCWSNIMTVHYFCRFRCAILSL